MQKRNFSCAQQLPTEKPVLPVCNSDETPTDIEAIKELTLEMQAKNLNISIGKLQAMRRYAAELMTRYPKMNQHRVASKVAKKFNVKLS